MVDSVADENPSTEVLPPPQIYLRRVMHNPARASTPQMSEEDKLRTIILEGATIYLTAPRGNTSHRQWILCGRHVRERYLYQRSAFEKKRKERLLVGDTLKFGHKDGLTHKAGETYANPEADFAFRAIMAEPNGDQFHQSIAEQIKEAKVKVYIGSPFVEEIEERDTVRSATRRVQEVQQREADSTEGTFPEVIDTSASSSSSSAASSPMANGTSNASSSTTTVPVEPSCSTSPGTTSSSTDNQTTKEWQHVFSKVRNPMLPSTSKAIIMPPDIPKRAPHDTFLSDPLNNYIYRTARYSPVYKKAVANQAVRFSREIEAFGPVILLLRHFLDIHVAHEQKTTLEQKLEVIDVFCVANEQTGGIEVLIENKQKLAEMLVKEEPNTSSIRDLLADIHDGPTSSEFEPSRNSAFQAPQMIYSPKPILPVCTEQAYIDYLRSIKKLPPVGNLLLTKRLADNACRRTLPVSPLQMTIIQLISEINSLDKEPVAYEHYLQALYRVIDVVPNESYEAPEPAPSVKPIVNETMEADDERNSASTGSVGSSNNFRNRSDSEESEIDVVGGADKEEEKEDGAETDNVPTPTPADMVKDIQKKEDVPEDFRKSCTPRIDAQSTPSAVVSALPTPMSSPIPKVSMIPSTSTAAPSVQKEEDALATEDEHLAKQVKGPSTSAASSEVTPKPKQQKERRMKQLDDSSGDSESEDDANKTAKASAQKKKSIRRSTRTAKTPATAKKVAKKNDQEGPSEEGEAAVATPRGGGRRKNLKRTASQLAIKEKRTPKAKEVKAVDEDGAEEAPKKKRGRKKATPPPEHDGQVSDEARPPVDPEKERCGVVSKSLCLCLKFEKKHNLEWVSCSLCDQWYHVFCVRLDNRCFGEQSFVCCGPNPTKEALNCLNGQISALYSSTPPARRPTPGSPDRHVP
uniref:BAH domain-containing protein n=1 Tax=Caenorhabditis tropicalis TaxID=1561998 RepID=A0A1I7TA93_9PELO